MLISPDDYTKSLRNYSWSLDSPECWASPWLSLSHNCCGRFLRRSMVHLLHLAPLSICFDQPATVREQASLVLVSSCPSAALRIGSCANPLRHGRAPPTYVQSPARPSAARFASERFLINQALPGPRRIGPLCPRYRPHF